jgi:hypothetical protein
MIDAVGPDHIRLIVEPTATIIEWRDAILAQLFTRNVPYGSIHRLYLSAHGSGGYVGIGQGLTDEVVRDLAPLAAWFRPYAGIPASIVLSGCNVASLYSIERADGSRDGVLCSGWHTPESSWLPNRPQDRGREVTVGHAGEPITSSYAFQLLYQLARTFHASAIAGVNSQPNGIEWNVLGPSLTVQPDGRFSLFGVELNDPHSGER